VVAQSTVTSLPVSDVTDVKGGDNWRITWKLQETAKKCQKTITRKLESGYSLKIFSPLHDVSVAALAFSREELENGKKNAKNVSRLLN
jgi:hypothetical protein